MSDLTNEQMMQAMQQMMHLQQQLAQAHGMPKPYIQQTEKLQKGLQQEAQQEISKKGKGKEAAAGKRATR